MYYFIHKASGILQTFPKSGSSWSSDILQVHSTRSSWRWYSSALNGPWMVGPAQLKLQIHSVCARDWFPIGTVGTVGTPMISWWNVPYFLHCGTFQMYISHISPSGTAVAQDQWCRCYLGRGRASLQICKDCKDGEDTEILRGHWDGIDMIYMIYIIYMMYSNWI